MLPKSIEVPAGYTVIPIDLLRDKSISSKAKLLYAHLWYLKNIQNKPPRKISQIAASFKCSFSRACAYIKELKSKQWFDGLTQQEMYEEIYPFV